MTNFTGLFIKSVKALKEECSFTGLFIYFCCEKLRLFLFGCKYEILFIWPDFDCYGVGNGDMAEPVVDDGKGGRDATWEERERERERVRERG